jgi:foldase protein PrsA
MVNGQAILLADYERGVAQYQQSLIQEGFDPESQAGDTELASVRREVLDGMIELVLMTQGAEDLGVVVTDDDVASQMESDIEAGGGDSAFADWLESTNQTRNDYAEMLYQSLLAQQVVDIVGGDVPVQAEQVLARRIVVTSEEEAQEILVLLEEGSNFEELAASRSVDPGTKNEGGSLGWFPRGAFEGEIERVVFALDPGELSGVLRLGDEYHIFQVVDHEMDRPLTSEVIIDLKLAALEQWLAGLRSAADIERYVSE